MTSGAEQIPQDFISARSRGAAISQEIVASYQQSLESLKTISELDRDGRHYEGLRIVLQELNVNSETRSRAQELAAELEKMTSAVQLIKKEPARNKAVEAITAEVTLITHLITYNEYLYRLLETIRSKLSGEKHQETITELIDRLNSEAKTINELNEKFNALIAEFDKYYK
jgi:DNA repair ATPase RecN